MMILLVVRARVPPQPTLDAWAGRVSCLKVVCECRYHGFIVSVFKGFNDGWVFKGYAWVDEVLVAKRKELVLCHG